MRKLWSNMRERTQNGEKELRITLISRVLKLCSEKTARKSCPEDVDNSTVAPQDYEVRQSGRLLDLQNTDLWI